MDGNGRTMLCLPIIRSFPAFSAARQYAFQSARAGKKFARIYDTTHLCRSPKLNLARVLSRGYRLERGRCAIIASTCPIYWSIKRRNSFHGFEFSRGYAMDLNFLKLQYLDSLQRRLILAAER